MRIVLLVNCCPFYFTRMYLNCLLTSGEASWVGQDDCNIYHTRNHIDTEWQSYFQLIFFLKFIINLQFWEHYIWLMRDTSSSHPLLVTATGSAECRLVIITLKHLYSSATYTSKLQYLKRKWHNAYEGCQMETQYLKTHTSSGMVLHST